ncbi:uncharacterized protein DS421_14g470590 [Arachis hypogaea]|nr:uncharacterized protein DS421_14g470590 [Arachis hypogaea]
MLMCDHLHPPDPYNEIVEPQLRETGFYYVSQIGVIKGQSAMINALIERWRPETHTFHFPVGECAVTLEDVALILGLPTNGLPVTGPTMSSFEALEAECLHQFGIAPRKTDCRGSFIKLKWFRGLKDRIVLNDDVHIQMATRVDCKEMDGPLILLVSWAWIRLPFLAPIPGNPGVFLIANRRLLDDLQEGQAYGIGYIDPDVIPLAIRHNSVIWSATVSLISFECIEWHATDRVRRQFGLTQGVPAQGQDLGASHGEVLTGPKNQDWADTHSLWVMQWTNRYSHTLSDDLEHLHYPLEIYMHWYRAAYGDHLQLSNLVFEENPEDTHPSDYYSASVPAHQQNWGGPQFEYGEQPSFSQLLGFMASGSYHSHSGNYVDIPTDHQAHLGGITPARGSLDLRSRVRTSSDNSGARMSVDSSRSAEAAEGIIQSGNPRRIPMTLIQESTATSEKGKGYNLRADPPRWSANRYIPSALNKIAKKCRKLYKDMKWAPRK